MVRLGDDTPPYFILRLEMMFFMKASISHTSCLSLQNDSFAMCLVYKVRGVFPAGCLPREVRGVAHARYLPHIYGISSDRYKDLPHNGLGSGLSVSPPLH